MELWDPCIHRFMDGRCAKNSVNHSIFTGIMNNSKDKKTLEKVMKDSRRIERLTDFSIET